jgi:hypothetical protein
MRAREDGAAYGATQQDALPMLLPSIPTQPPPPPPPVMVGRPTAAVTVIMVMEAAAAVRITNTPTVLEAACQASIHNRRCIVILRM